MFTSEFVRTMCLLLCGMRVKRCVACLLTWVGLCRVLRLWQLGCSLC